MVNQIERVGKATVFISYAREDRDFVRILEKKLEERGVEAKGDWLLTTGEDYEKRLREFNLGTHAFIFVISPDSIKSQACRDELALAVEHRKQILPVSWRDHDDDNLLDFALRVPQWTFLREGNDAESALSDLIKAINTDFALMDMHGRLLVAADNWHNNGRNRSYLLRRDGLKNAEGWLAMTGAQPDRLPQPTRLESEFVFASQRARSRGLRVGLGIAFSVILALTILSVVAWVQRAKAVTNAAEADHQADIAKNNEIDANHQRIEAERQKHLAEDQAREADKQRKKAEENANEARLQQAKAEKQTQIAEERLTRNQHLLYASNVGLAHEAYQDANMQKMGGLLEPYLPNSRSTDQEVRSKSGDLRGFEWFYLWNLNHGERSVLREPKGDVYKVVFSPDGKIIAGSDANRVITLWQASTATPTGVIKAGSITFALAFSPDGGTLISGGYDKAIRFWNSSNGKETAPPLTGHEGTIKALAVSPDGRMLASAADDDHWIRFWDLNSHKEMTPIENPKSTLTSLAYIPKSNLLAGAHWDNSISLWDVSSKKQVGVLNGHLAKVGSVAASPDGKLLASASDDRTVKLWDVATQKELYSFVGHQESVYSVNFSNDGKFLVSSSEDLTIKLWEVASKSLLITFRGHTGAVNSVAFSPNGKELISGSRDGTVRVWDTTSKEFTLLKGHEIGPNAVAFSPNGKLLASASNDWTVKLWDAISGQPLASLDARAGEVVALAFSPNGRMLVSIVGNLVIVWDVAKHTDITSFNSENWLHRLAFSTDGKTLALGDKEGNIELRRTSDWRTFKVLKVSKDFVSALAFSPDGRFLAYAGNSGSIELRDTATWRMRRKLDAGAGVQALAFTRDGGKVASAGGSAGIKLWDMRSSEEISTPPGHLFSVSSLAFSPDGKTLASAGYDKVIRLWDTSTLRELTVLKGHSSYINSIAFSSDGQILASAGYDKSIFLWYGFRGSSKSK
jgi:WD40 repeat protein